MAKRKHKGQRPRRGLQVTPCSFDPYYKWNKADRARENETIDSATMLNLELSNWFYLYLEANPTANLSVEDTLDEKGLDFDDLTDEEALALLKEVKRHRFKEVMGGFLESLK